MYSIRKSSEGMPVIREEDSEFAFGHSGLLYHLGGDEGRDTDALTLCEPILVLFLYTVLSRVVVNQVRVTISWQ